MSRTLWQIVERMALPKILDCWWSWWDSNIWTVQQLLVWLADDLSKMLECFPWSHQSQMKEFPLTPWHEVAGQKLQGNRDNGGHVFHYSCWYSLMLIYMFCPMSLVPSQEYFSFVKAQPGHLSNFSYLQDPLVTWSRYIQPARYRWWHKPLQRWGMQEYV